MKQLFYAKYVNNLSGDEKWDERMQYPFDKKQSNFFLSFIFNIFYTFDIKVLLYNQFQCYKAVIYALVFVNLCFY